MNGRRSLKFAPGAGMAPSVLAVALLNDRRFLFEGKIERPQKAPRRVLAHLHASLGKQVLLKLCRGGLRHVPTRPAILSRCPSRTRFRCPPIWPGAQDPVCLTRFISFDIVKAAMRHRRATARQQSASHIVSTIRLRRSFPKGFATSAPLPDGYNEPQTNEKGNL